MRRASAHLEIVQDGECHPYRRVAPDRPEEETPRVLCVECRHVIVREHHVGRDLAWAYSCGARPRYEQHVNYIDGSEIFFDRERWNEILEFQSKGWEWALEKTERDYFHESQSHEACVDHNPDGLCDLHEPKTERTRPVVEPAVPWRTVAVVATSLLLVTWALVALT